MRIRILVFGLVPVACVSLAWHMVAPRARSWRLRCASLGTVGRGPALLALCNPGVRRRTANKLAHRRLLAMEPRAYDGPPACAFLA